ncbi:MAG: hypothetical protein RIQ81_995 [Pseudomonadota bacterium]
MPQAPVIMPVEPGYGRIAPRPAPAAKPAQKAGGSSFSATPAYSNTQVFSHKDYHGLRTGSGKTQTREFKVKLQAQSESPVKSAGGAMFTLGLPVELKHSIINSTGEEFGFSRDEDNPDTVLGSTKVTTSPTSTAVTINAGPGVSLPFSSSVELEGTYNYTLVLPDFKTDEKSTRHKPEASINADAGAWTFTGKLAFDENFNKSDELQSSSTILTGTASAPVGKAVVNVSLTQTSTDVPGAIRPTSNTAASSLAANGSAKFDGESIDFTLSAIYLALERFPDAPIRAPGEVMGAAASMDIPFGIFSIGGSFGFKSLADLRQTYKTKDADGNDSTQEVIAEGDQTGFSGNFKVTAVKWLSLSTEFVKTTTKWQTNNSVAQKDFLKANPDQEGLTTINATLSWQF